MKPDNSEIVENILKKYRREIDDVSDEIISDNKEIRKNAVKKMILISGAVSLGYKFKMEDIIQRD